MDNTEQERVKDLLKDIQLDQFYRQIHGKLHITRLTHFDHVTEEDLDDLGMAKPEQRRLLEALKKAKKKSLFSSFKRKVSVQTEVIGFMNHWTHFVRWLCFDYALNEIPRLCFNLFLSYEFPPLCFLIMLREWICFISTRIAYFKSVQFVDRIPSLRLYYWKQNKIFMFDRYVTHCHVCKFHTIWHHTSKRKTNTVLQHATCFD